MAADRSDDRDHRAHCVDDNEAKPVNVGELLHVMDTRFDDLASPNHT
jgi:hypothetical protein